MIVNLSTILYFDDFLPENHLKKSIISKNDFFFYSDVNSFFVSRLNKEYIQMEPRTLSF